MDEKRYKDIFLELDLQAVTKPSVLFKILKQSDYKLEEKVSFILHWYGWHSNRNYVSADLKKALNTNYPFFQRGINFIRQFDGMILPGKCTSSCQGSHILLSFVYEPVISEGVSNHFGERVISIGIERLFDSYDENVPGCWEDVSIPSDELDYDCITLFLGESGIIYWFCYDGDSLGIAGNSILEFFASRFSLIDDCDTFNSCSFWTAEDKKIMHDFQKNSIEDRSVYPTKVKGTF